MTNTNPAPEQEMMTGDNFEALLEESFIAQEGLEGSVVEGRVTAIEGDHAVIDVGLKSEGRIPLKEFAVPGQESELSVGDKVEVYIDRMENAQGEVVISRERAAARKPGRSWKRRSRAMSASTASSSAGSRVVAPSTFRARSRSCRAARSTSARCATSPR